MKKVAVFLILFYLPIIVIAQEDILKKIDEIRAPAENFSFNLKIITEEKDKKTVIECQVAVRDATKSLVKFTYPPTEKGKILLMVNNDMWISFPTAQRAIRISPQQRLIGDASNADVARVVYSIDYRIINMGEDEVDHKKMYKLELGPKTKDAPYGKILLWVEKETYKPYKAQFYSLFGKLLKTVYYRNYKEILGKERPTEIEIYSVLSKDRVTFMQYSNFELISLPENYFQKDYLKYIK